jgi:hypothetical protein
MRVARAYENGDRILVRVDGAMARNMLDSQQIRNILSALSAGLAPTQIAPDKFDFVETGDTATVLAPIDELQDT